MVRDFRIFGFSVGIENIFGFRIVGFLILEIGGGREISLRGLR